jgi:hypothetical protein
VHLSCLHLPNAVRLTGKAPRSRHQSEPTSPDALSALKRLLDASRSACRHQRPHPPAGSVLKSQISPCSVSVSTPRTSCRFRCHDRSGPSASTWNLSVS